MTDVTVSDDATSQAVEASAVETTQQQPAPAIEPAQAKALEAAVTEVTSAEVAHQVADLMDAHKRAAQMIRDKGNRFLEIAQLAKTSGDALALDIERRVEQFQGMVESMSAYAKQQEDLYTTEKERLDAFPMPRNGGGR